MSRDHEKSKVNMPAQTSREAQPAQTSWEAQPAPGTRLNKFLADAGLCSRRQADQMIADGRVTVNGAPAETGMRVMPGDVVKADGKPVTPEEEEILIAFHKPRGIVCTSNPKEKDNIIEYINYPKRIYTVGRLDKDSEGLILLTNQGDLVNRIMRAGNYHEKEYLVTVDRPYTEDFLEKLSAGVYLEELDVTTRKCEVTMVDEKRFRIILTQGYNRQIRRMCETLGYEVKRLIRERIMNIELTGLPLGQWRDVTVQEKQVLSQLIADSYSAPIGS